MSMFGTFEKCVTKEDCEFYKSLGMAVEDSMVGCKVCFKTCDLGNGKILAEWKFDKCPEMNSCNIFKEGVKNEVCLPQMGGKCCVTWKKTEKGFESCIESEACGKWDFCEEYSEEGVKIISTCQGKSHTEHYKRVVCIDGMYKCTKTTNTKDFMKKCGYPDEVCGLLDEDFCVCVKECSEGLWIVEKFGDHKIETKAKFDCEQDSPEFPGVPKAKFVVSKTGPGKFCLVQKDENGCTQEWTYQFCDKGMKMCGRNLKTGDTCSIELAKECCPIMGTWKPISICGAKELMMKIGAPADMACKVANDFCHRVKVCEKGPVCMYKYDSKILPFECAFKYDEEFCFEDPVLKENCKAVVTKAGNCVTMVQCSSMGTWVTKMTVGNCFMTSKVHMKECPEMCMTSIYCREC